MITVKIILDSLSPDNVRLTTFELKYPRFILSELNTHRVFSRNSASSRAIPVKKMLSDVLKDPVIPVFWGKNQAGMQAREELTGVNLHMAKFLWKFSRYPTCLVVYLLNKIGLHKQIANRMLEPWMWTKTIVTSTEWENFFSLRCHPDAQPEIKELAEKMKVEYESSLPKHLTYNQWHLPYITEEEEKEHSLEKCLKISVARCARVSYLTHDGKMTDYSKDINLYTKLVESHPKHLSPTEHQATPIISKSARHVTHINRYGHPCSGNLRGWIQYRQML